ncbi:unnamed protein product, partial [Amoebophrya sp. A120]
ALEIKPHLHNSTATSAPLIFTVGRFIRILFAIEDHFHDERSIQSLRSFNPL